MKYKKRIKSNKLLMPLNESEKLCAAVFCCTLFIILIVNNYDITRLQAKFLSIWMENPSTTTISASLLFDLIEIEYLDIFKKYFAENSIIYNI